MLNVPPFNVYPHKSCCSPKLTFMVAVLLMELEDSRCFKKRMPQFQIYDKSFLRATIIHEGLIACKILMIVENENLKAFIFQCIILYRIYVNRGYIIKVKLISKL